MRLQYVAYALELLTREERADGGMAVISENFNPKQKVFLNFVLSHSASLGWPCSAQKKPPSGGQRGDTR
jgi:hypothetical protein